MATRTSGPATEITLADTTGQMQVYIRKDSVGDEQFSAFKKYDIGDIVGAEAVITGTSSGLGRLALDDFGRSWGWTRGPPSCWARSSVGQLCRAVTS